MNLASLYNIKQTKPAADDLSNISVVRDIYAVYFEENVDWNQYIAPICFMLLGIIIIICNVLTIHAISITPSLRTLSNKFIVSLAAVDVLVGLGVVVLGVFKLPTFHDHESVHLSCFFFSTVLIGVLIISILHLMCIAIERCVYITMPFFYIVHVDRKVITCAIISTCIVGFIFFIPPLFIQDPAAIEECKAWLNMPMTYTIPMNSIGLVAGIVTVVMYVSIWKTVQKQRNSINTQSQSWGSSSEGRPSGGVAFAEINMKTIQMENRSSKDSQPDASHERNSINAQSLPSGGWTLVKGIFGDAAPAETDVTPIQMENKSSMNSQPDISESISEKGGSTGGRPIAEILAPGRKMVSWVMSRTNAAPNHGTTRRTIGSVKLFIFISCAYIFCMIPSTLSPNAKYFTNVKIPDAVDSTLSLIALSSSALNFFILIIWNNKFRMSVHRILRCGCTPGCRASKDDRLNVTSSLKLSQLNETMHHT